MRHSRVFDERVLTAAHKGARRGPGGGRGGAHKAARRGPQGGAAGLSGRTGERRGASRRIWAPRRDFRANRP